RAVRWLGRVARLGARALAGPQRIGLGSLREAIGVLPLQLEHALGVVEQRLARTMEERLLAGRVQVPKLMLQRLIVQLTRIEAELPRHDSPLPSGSRSTTLPAPAQPT